jgi:hypothetical protein
LIGRHEIVPEFRMRTHSALVFPFRASVTVAFSAARLATRGVLGEARILAPFGMAEHGCEAGELAVVEGRQQDVAVIHRKDAVWRRTWVVVAGAPDLPAPRSPRV